MSKIITEEKIIDEILNRGTIVEVFPSKDEFRKKLLSGEKLRFYWGFDATATTLHLSHAKNFILFEKLRRLGHEVIVLFGDFTARIGDPTDKTSARQQLSREDVLNNVAKWKELIRPLMDFDDKENPPVIKYNHDWLSKLTFEDIIGLASNFTVQQMLERYMFQKRLKEEKPIFLHEFLYPLMQGYDSVAMDVDVEMCGTDQIFNALAGRHLIRKVKDKEKFVVAVTLMENPKTGELMSKSKGIGVFLGCNANEMYAQVMGQADEMIEILFINNTYLTLDGIRDIMKLENPRDSKMRLAFEITKLLYGVKEAENAQNEFIKVVQNKELPSHIETRDVKKSNIIEVVSDVFNISKSEARRLIDQKAVKFNDEIIDNYEFNVENDGLLKAGKKNIVNLKLK